MKSAWAILALLSLLLVATAVESRKDPAGEYWRIVMKDKPMPEAIQGRIIGHEASGSRPKNSELKSNCDHGRTTLSDSFTEDFEPTPNATAYPDDDAKLAAETFAKDSEPIWADVTASHWKTDVGPKAGKLFAQDFEPIPDATRYNE